MSSTCARVLAAALMTGTIAAALALPGLVGDRPGRPDALTAPPSSLERVVRVPGQAPAVRSGPSGASTDHRSTLLAGVELHGLPGKGAGRAVSRGGRASAPRPTGGSGGGT